MIKKLTLACVTAGLLVATAALPSSASAIPCAEGEDATCEWDIAKPADEPLGGMPCVATSRSEVCFEIEGDEIWVQDQERDGRSAIAFWATDGPRSGYCRNRSKFGNWAYCNKNFPEKTDVTLLAGTYNKSGPGPNDHIYDEFSEELTVLNSPD